MADNFDESQFSNQFGNTLALSNSNNRSSQARGGSRQPKRGSRQSQRGGGQHHTQFGHRNANLQSDAQYMQHIFGQDQNVTPRHTSFDSRNGFSRREVNRRGRGGRGFNHQSLTHNTYNSDNYPVNFSSSQRNQRSFDPSSRPKVEPRCNYCKAKNPLNSLVMCFRTKKWFCNSYSAL